jgi:hypothetical protein
MLRFVEGLEPPERPSDAPSTQDRPSVAGCGHDRAEGSQPGRLPLAVRSRLTMARSQVARCEWCRLRDLEGVPGSERPRTSACPVLRDVRPAPTQRPPGCADDAGGPHGNGRRSRRVVRRAAVVPLRAPTQRSARVRRQIPVSHDSEPQPVTAYPGGPLNGALKPPGDKSISHRAMILGLLAIGETQGRAVCSRATTCCAPPPPPSALGAHRPLVTAPGRLADRAGRRRRRLAAIRPMCSISAMPAPARA